MPAIIFLLWRVLCQDLALPWVSTHADVDAAAPSLGKFSLLFIEKAGIQLPNQILHPDFPLCLLLNSPHPLGSASGMFLSQILLICQMALSQEGTQFGTIPWTPPDRQHALVH